MSLLLNMSITRKLAAAFTLLVALTSIIGALNLRTLSAVKGSTDDRSVTFRVIDLTDRMMAGMIDQESGIRGYLISADQAFLDPYRRGQAAFTQAAEAARAEMVVPVQIARLDDVVRLAGSWRQDVAEQEISLMANPQTREQARAMEAGGAGKAAMESIRGRIGEIAAAAQAILAQRDRTESNAFALASMMTAGGIATSLVVACLLGWLLASLIAAPTREMTTAMQRLAGGDTGVEIASRERADEIGRMAAAVQATQAVSESIGDVSRAAHETGEAAGLVLDAARSLSKQAAILSSEVGSFVTGVKAA